MSKKSVIFVLSIALSCAGAAAQVKPQVQRPVTTRPLISSPYGSSENAQTGARFAQGTVAGAIFWDPTRVAYNPSVPCQALQVELSDIDATGSHSLATTNQFKFTQSPRPGPGNRLCSYSFSRVPEGVALRVQVSIGQPFTAQVAAIGPFGATGGLIKILGGQCNNPPNGTALSLEAGWQSCGDQAYNVNFDLHPTNRLGLRPPVSVGTPLLRNPGTGATQSQGMLTKPGSNGGLPDGLNPALKAPVSKLTGGSGGRAVETTQQTVKPPLVRLAPPRALRRITNSHLAQQDAALIEALREQRQLADQRTAQMRLAVGSATKISTNGTVSRSHTVAPNVQTRASAPRQQIGPERTEDESGTSGFHIANRHYAEPLVILCAQDPASRIVYAPKVFTPEAKYNSYSIGGCGFGPSANGNAAYIFGADGFRENLAVDFWSEHGITAHLNPALTDILDQKNITLVVAPSGKQEMKISGLSFYAARQESLLGYDSLPQSQVSLRESGAYIAGHFEQTPVPQLNASYDQIPSNAASQFSSFSFQGTPVAGWVFRYAYGHYDNGADWDCYINDVHSVGPSTVIEGPCMNYFNYLYYATEGGVDVWTFPLAPGFEISSFQLYYEDTDARSLCGAWDEVSHKDGLVGRWDFNLAVAPMNTIMVNWPAYYCTDEEGAPVNRVNTQYQSTYGLAVWVTGPRGIDPWTGKPTGK